MKDQVVLDADCTSRLLAAGKLDLVQKLFGSAVITETNLRELKDRGFGYAKAWAEKVMAKEIPWVSVRNPQREDPKIAVFNRERDKERERGGGNVRGLDPGEASAISMAKELQAETGDRALVLSNDKQVKDFLNAEKGNQKVFATGYWSVVMQAAGRGLIDLEKERPHLERFCNPNSTQRDHVNELDVRTSVIGIKNKGYTEKEIIDMYQNSDWLKQQTKIFEQQRAAQHSIDLEQSR